MHIVSAIRCVAPYAFGRRSELAGWVERLVRRSSKSEGGSDTHQLLFNKRRWAARNAIKQ